MDFIKNLGGEDNKQSQQKPHAEQPAKPAEQQGGGFMDKLGSLAGGQKESQPQKEESSGGFMDKINSMAGGGKSSEKKEDALDKGLYFLPLPCPLSHPAPGYRIWIAYTFGHPPSSHDARC